MTATDPVELGGIAEIAEEFGVNRQTASMWGTRRASSQFPEPVAELASGPVYDMAAVRRWHAARKPRKGAER